MRQFSPSKRVAGVLDRLAVLDERQHRVVELRYSGT